MTAAVHKLQRTVILVGLICVVSVLLTTPTVLSRRMYKVSPVIHPTIILAINVWAEARGEPYKGKLGVAFATMNRVGDKRWPKSVHDVVLQAWQFSWTNPSDPNRMRMDEISWDDPFFVEAHKAACAAFYKLVADPTNGANHYLNPNVVKSLPDWYHKGKLTATIGAHEFFKL